MLKYNHVFLGNFWSLISIKIKLEKKIEQKKLKLNQRNKGGAWVKYGMNWKLKVSQMLVD